MPGEEIRVLERIVKLEVEVGGLREQARAHATDTKENFTKLGDKLDDLAGTIGRIRGVGFVFTIIGAGVVSLVAAMVNMMFNKLMN